MTKKELRAQYKYTFLGLFWLAANPILKMLVMGFVFTFFIVFIQSNAKHSLRTVTDKKGILSQIGHPALDYIV